MSLSSGVLGHISWDFKAGAMTFSMAASVTAGSISCAGLFSYIYADMKHDDPRVLAVFNWLKQNYTLNESPGMGPQGLYYYYHTMAKALSLYGVDDLDLPASRKVDWRKDLAS